MSGTADGRDGIVNLLDDSPQDITPPVAICQDISVALDASGNASITGAQVDNGSNDAAGIASLSVSPNSFTSADVGLNTVTLTVTDNNGNTSICAATVTVEDTTPPTAVKAVSDGDGDGVLDSPTITLTATDGGTGVASISFSIDGAPFTTLPGSALSFPFPVGTHTRLLCYGQRWKCCANADANTYLP